MNIKCFLAICALMSFTTAALAEEWVEVFSEINSKGSKFYFDGDIKPAGRSSIKTQYMIVETQTLQTGPKDKEAPGIDYNKTIFQVAIDCSAKTWNFLHRAYFMDSSLKFEADVEGGKMPVPPQGSAAFNVAEKACALR